MPLLQQLKTRAPHLPPAGQKASRPNPSCFPDDFFRNSGKPQNQSRTGVKSLSLEQDGGQIFIFDTLPGVTRVGRAGVKSLPLVPGHRQQQGQLVARTFCGTIFLLHGSYAI